MSGTTPSYITGNQDQYVKADGSLSTAMNSRVEVNFTATSGQTTFTTPYDVGQIDVYYNGSKLNPSEFTATNGTTVVLAQAATLNAQISIVKYVAALSTTAIRNETTFTATAGQTTFSVNYTVGQLDVFYNGSKLNVSEFTATNGTSVVLGFACVAGESVVFVSYVNQVSGASGTANRVAKFTGAATLGDSQITDNGTTVSIGNTGASTWGSLSKSIQIGNRAAIFSFNNSTSDIGLNMFWNASNSDYNYIETGAASFYRQSSGNHIWYSASSGTAGTVISFVPTMTLNNLGNLGVGESSPLTKTHIVGSAQFGGVLRVDNNVNQGDVNHGIINLVNTATHAIGNDASIMFSGRESSGTIHPRASIGMKISSSTLSGDLVFNTRNDSNFAERMRITSGGNVLINKTTSDVGGALEVNSFSTTNTIVANSTSTNAPSIYLRDAGGAGSGYIQSNSDLAFRAGLTERMRITSGGLVYMYEVYNNTSGSGANVGINSLGLLYRSTSSLKYKKNVKDYNKGLNEIMQMRPVTYNSINKSENGVKYAGLIAEEIHDLGLTEFVQYANDGTPDALAYSNMVALLVKGMQEQQAQIKELQDEIISLKNK
jgi:hypothetical protein